MPEKDKKKPILEYTILITIIIVAIGVFNYITQDKDVAFARTVFAGLISARESTAKLIDWQNFKALDVDIAATYANLSNEKERKNYKKVFIQGLSFGFKSTGARFAAFINWRIYQRDLEKVIVACDYPAKNKTLLFTILKDTKPKLLSMQWEAVK